MQLARHPVGRLLALQNVVVAGAIARLMNLVERGRAQKFVVVRKDPFVVTKTADRRVELLVIRAPRIAGHHIVNDSIAVHNCAVKHLIAQIRQIAPTVDVRLGQPKMIGAKTARGNRIAEHHGAFPRRRIVVEQRGKLRRRRQGIGGLDVKSDDRICRSARNCGAVDAVAGNRIAASSVVEHVEGCVRGAGINTVFELDGLHPVRVVNAGGHHHALICRRQGGRVRDFVDRRRCVGCSSTVGRAGRPQVGRNGHGAGGFQPVAAEPEKNLRPASQPARLETQRGRLACGQ